MVEGNETNASFTQKNSSVVCVLLSKLVGHLLPLSSSLAIAELLTFSRLRLELEKKKISSQRKLEWISIACAIPFNTAASGK